MRWRFIEWLKLTYELYKHPESRTREEWIEYLNLTPGEVPEFNAYWKDRHG